MINKGELKKCWLEYHNPPFTLSRQNTKRLLESVEQLQARVAELEDGLLSASKYFEMLSRSTGVDHPELIQIQQLLNKEQT